MKLSTATEKTILLGLTLLAFLLRAYRLNEQSYWIDEAWTIFYAHLSLSELWLNLQTIRAAPPLYHLLTMGWVQLIGDSEYALRFLSLLPGVLAVPLVYRLGGALGDRRLGLLTALLLAISPYQIWHSQDARNYSLLTAASVASLWAFLEMWRRGGWRWWLLYIVATETAVMTHYHGLVVIGIQGLFFLVTWRRHWRRYLPWAGTLLLILLPLAVWLTLGSTLWQSEHWLPFVGLGDSYLRSAIAYSVGELVPRPTALWLTAFFGLLYLLGLIYAARRRWHGWQGWEMTAFLLIFTLTPNIATWLYSQLGTPVYLERYLIVVQVGYLLTIAAGVLALIDAPARQRGTEIEAQRRQYPKSPLRGFLTAVGLLIPLTISGWVLLHHYADPVYAKPDWRGVIEMIDQYGQPGDAVLLTGDGGEKLFDFYYDGPLPVYTDFNTPVPPPDEARQIISEITARHERLWYTPYGVAIDPLLEAWLAENSYPAWQRWIGRKRLALYATRPDLDRTEPVQATFSDGQGQTLHLSRVSLPAEAVPAGDLLPLQLMWQVEGDFTRDVQLSLRLVNTRGDLFAQSDWPPFAAGPTSTWPAGQPVTDHRSLWLPPDLPPDDYVLQLVLYDPLSGVSFGQPGLIPNIPVAPAQIIPPLDTLPIPNFGQKRVGEINLVGYAAPERLQPGQEMWLWLYWHTAVPLQSEPALHLNLVSVSETITTVVELAQSVGPLDSWQPGQVRRAIYHLPTLPHLQGEQATLSVALDSTTPIALTTIDLDQRSRQFELPAINQPLEVTWGQEPVLKLLGYDLPTTTLAPSDVLPLTLYWQAEAELDINYTVFVQLLNSEQQVVAQVDAQPQNGAAPTTTWLPGEIVIDAYQLNLPADLPDGEYRLIAGLYDAISGARLPLTNDDNFVELNQIKIQQKIIPSQLDK